MPESQKIGNGQIEWAWDGHAVSVGLTRYGTGPSLLLLPALSSISTRHEMWPLQQRLGAAFTTVAVDWPGFGDQPRPRADWRPDAYRAFLAHVLAHVVQPVATVAAGHGAGYALAQAAEAPGLAGRLCLLSPTWRGPLPTMAGKRLALFRWLVAIGDLPAIGPLLYRLNVNDFVIGKMARGHVYAAPAWLTPERLAAKRSVVGARGARHASIRFVTGALDPFTDRAAFLEAGRKVGEGCLVVHAANAPPKSKHEMQELGRLPNVEGRELPEGKLSFYEEFPDSVAPLIEAFARGAGDAPVRYAASAS